MAEPQRRSPGARVEDTWYRRDKTPKARNGLVNGGVLSS